MNECAFVGTLQARPWQEPRELLVGDSGSPSLPHRAHVVLVVEDEDAAESIGRGCTCQLW